MAENDESANDGSIEIDDLSEDQLKSLLENPDVKKAIRYDTETIQNAKDALETLTEAEEGTEENDTYGLLVEGIADRSGRVTKSTVKTVLTGLVEEVNEET